MLADTLRHTHFPYCLDRQADGSYVMLNRNYKPIGFMTSDWVVYEEEPIGVNIKGLTAKKAASISYAGSEDLDRIYLYNDGTTPTTSEDKAAYFKRLSILMDLKISQ
ncbi:hypothetical protein [Halomonas sp. 15WGF]|jgi:hypothetical protein|uniref:hypothetical protein n=1 Tax=Halomonas sp. 15WGF TaxID=2570357 RepID=UPI0010BEE65B|nr:hypothetical protein [Halomonas sp. 15WGF]TKJ10222.1 hypothetical protein E8Q34_12365 [Halomonas sp. 15WGF]